MKKCGIYKITNTANSKVYIGQSTHIGTRFYIHKYSLRHNIHPNPHLQASWNKHGEKFFIFKIIELCKPENLDEREIYYINLYNSYNKGYNKTVGGQLDGLIFKKLSPKDRAKFSKIRSETAKRNMETRRASKGKCKTCGAKTKDGWTRYCENHKCECKECGKRYKKEKGYRICPSCLRLKNPKIISVCECGREFIKHNNKQKYCKTCAKNHMLKQKREWIWKIRHT